MTKSGLPQASTFQKTIKFGGIIIKPEKPTQSLAQAKKGLDNLEIAAKQKVFIKNEPIE